MNKKKQYIYPIILVIILMIPNLLLIVIGQDSVVASLLKKIVFSLLCLSIIIFPLVFIKPKYFSWFVVFITPLLLFETSVINHFKVTSSEETVATIFLTNYYEITELIKGNALAFIFGVLLFLSTLFISFKIKKNFSLSQKIKTYILFFCLGFMAVLYTRNVLVAMKLNDNTTEIFGLANYSLRVQLNKVFPLNIFMKLNNAYDGIQKKKNYKNTIKNFKFSAVKKDTLHQQEIYVLVIGETARKHNFSLYGYDRKTSPNLDTITSIFPFKNANANANLTALSIPFILTRATPNNPEIKYTEPAVLNIFKEAGFKTYWISNQSIGVGSVFGFYASLADEYKNISVSIDAANYDGTLFPVLEDVLQDSSTNKKFIVIHTLGSHFRYNYRYPENFNQYKPSLSRVLSLENTSSISKKEELINSYDNSILYTDYVISNFINQLKNKNVVSYLYYISDHGENLYDDDRNKLMHGYIKATNYEIEIPLVIWTSKKYNTIFNDKVIALKNNINSKINSVNTFHTLTDLANISYSSEKITQSFASKKFDTLQKRYFYRTNKTVYKID